MTRILVVTNDFPPRPGGIQTFLHGIVSRLPADDVCVYTSRWRGDAEWDATQPYRVVREDTSVLLPTPGVRRRAASLVADHGAELVWFGAAAPLGLLAPAVRRAGATRIIATTHGHEAGWAVVPAGRSVLRRITAGVDVLTYLGDYTRLALERAVGPYGSRLARLTPGVDAAMFTPQVDGTGVRAALGLATRPVVVCVSRLMPRKGQDVLVRALPDIRREVPDAALLLVGGGPERGKLGDLARRHGVASSVVVTGSRPWADLPAHYRAGDVFAMPCRTRLGGLDVEGLGMVFLEAAACGLPVVAGDSGGAPDAVLDGQTGFVVPGASVDAVAASVTGLLRDPLAAAAMGDRGRAWVEAEWTWERVVDRFRALAAG